jgi:hypothetical protein
VNENVAKVDAKREQKTEALLRFPQEGTQQ